MKKIIGILLIGFLGFLGCSGSDDATSTTVGQATPVAPWAIIETTTPTYEWTPVRGATRYRLLVQDANEASTIQDAQETYIIDEWYTAEEAECASEDEGLCMVTPDIEVFEEYTWKVQACANQECGVWSEDIGYRVTPPGSAGAPRFTDNGDETVTDNNTKLMWTKSADLWGVWYYAKDECDALVLAGHSDWRLPSLYELKSLIDRSQSDPALPLNNPFTNMQLEDYYWSSTKYRPGVRSGWWGVDMTYGDAIYGIKVNAVGNVWPVRSGN